MRQGCSHRPASSRPLVATSLLQLHVFMRMCRVEQGSPCGVEGGGHLHRAFEVASPGALHAPFVRQVCEAADEPARAETAARDQAAPEVAPPTVASLQRVEAEGARACGGSAWSSPSTPSSGALTRVATGPPTCGQDGDSLPGSSQGRRYAKRNHGFPSPTVSSAKTRGYSCELRGDHDRRVATPQRVGRVVTLKITNTTSTTF